LALRPGREHAAGWEEAGNRIAYVIDAGLAAGWDRWHRPVGHHPRAGKAESAAFDFGPSRAVNRRKSGGFLGMRRTVGSDAAPDSIALPAGELALGKA